VIGHFGQKHQNGAILSLKSSKWFNFEVVSRNDFIVLKLYQISTISISIKIKKKITTN